MIQAAVTGAAGFIGRNLVAHLDRLEGVEVLRILRADSMESVRAKLSTADVVYHLAGSNRPERAGEFYEVNEAFTETVVRVLSEQDRRPTIVLASSTQAELNNDYGRSKKGAEAALEHYGSRGGSAVIYRLTNVFGKWSRPRYNSVVATFCHNISHNLAIEVHDPNAEVSLVYVDDVVQAFLSHLEGEAAGVHRAEAGPIYRLTLRDLVQRLHALRESRETLRLPQLGDRFMRLLQATYLSFLPTDDFAYPLEERKDERGKLAEFLKSDYAGQIFVSTTSPGVTRGQHYHHTKTEKFCVLSGHGIIRFRRVGSHEVLTYSVSGDAFTVVDIPPGYTHSIENVGDSDMVVLFWANEIFDPQRPDTYYLDIES